MPVSPVAANSVATSGWANSVSTSVNDIEADIYAAGQLAIPWTFVTGKPATFTPIVAGSTAAITYGLSKADGVSTSAARADHTHGTPPLPTAAQLAIPWTSITGKPSTFTPSAHATTHNAGQSDPISLSGIGAMRAMNSPGTEWGGKRTYVGTATPTGMAEGDVWIKG